MLFEGIILKCSSHIKGERTISAIYHLLNGKRSIQTVQDAHIYQLEKFYGIYRSLQKSTFDKKVYELLHNELLMPLSNLDSYYRLSEHGERWLVLHKASNLFKYFRGLKYYETGPIFFDRLLLVIQVVTNRDHHNPSYIPVIDKHSIKMWVKKYYKHTQDANKQLHQLYEELAYLLSNFPNREASLFVDRLTGFKKYGMSMYQLADRYEIDLNDVWLLLTGVTHQMIEMINNEVPKFPILAFILKDLSVSGVLTNSAKETYRLIKKHHSIETIAQIRQLKRGTIYDHIVEISLYDTSFPIHAYVTEKEQQEILRVVKQTNSFKLKEIKNKVNEKISYFQIRLTLAVKTGDEN